MAENKQYITYEMFGAKGDGVTDDTAAMRAAHEYANSTYTEVKTDPTATYYVGVMDEPIKIMTNVDFGTSKFRVDDREVPLEKRAVPLFRVV